MFGLFWLFSVAISPEAVPFVPRTVISTEFIVILFFDICKLPFVSEIFSLKSLNMMLPFRILKSAVSRRLSLFIAPLRTSVESIFPDRDFMSFIESFALLRAGLVFMSSKAEAASRFGALRVRFIC